MREIRRNEEKLTPTCFSSPKYLSFLFHLQTCNRSDPWYAPHFNELVSGLDSLVLKSKINSRLVTFTEESFPVILSGSGDAMVAAAVAGQASAERKHCVQSAPLNPITLGPGFLIGLSG